MKNKKIGIIGGVGPQATQVLYKQIIELSQSLYKAHANHEFPRIVIESVPIYDFISNTNKIEGAFKELEVATQSLKITGATRIAIASNTVHLLLDRLQAKTDVGFISMIDAVVQECVNKKYRTVGLVASPMTLKQDLYDSKLKAKGAKLIKPTFQERKVIEKMIRYYLAGESNGRYKHLYINVLSNLFEKGCEAVILGCTELPLVINYEALGDRVINSSQVLARNLVDYYYN